ncbi:MAG: hypothetical protein JWM89_1152 [Acidimicrobiales bacterium]|nr:hypothetical protein [Acidimicrobiales bacterium]
MIAYLLLGAFLSLPVWCVAAIVSAARIPARSWDASNRTRGATIALVILSGGVGGIYYLLAVRPELRRLAGTAPETARIGRRDRWATDPWADD